MLQYTPEMIQFTLLNFYNQETMNNFSLFPLGESNQLRSSFKKSSRNKLFFDSGVSQDYLFFKIIILGIRENVYACVGN